MKKKIISFLCLILFFFGLYFYQSPLEIISSVAEKGYWIMGLKKDIVGPFDVFKNEPCTPSSGKCVCTLLIHGIGDNNLTWLPLAQELLFETQNRSQNLYFINLPGSGQSPKLKELKDYNGQSLAELFYNTFSSQCENTIIIGNSLGGYIALKTARYYPSFVKQLILLSPAGLNQDYSHVTQIYLNPTAENVKTLHQMGYFHPLPIPTFIYKDLAKRFKEVVPVKEYIKAQSPSDSVEQDLPFIKAKTILVWGEQDKIFPPRFGEILSTGIKNSELRVIPQCAHLEQKECPSAVLEAYKDLNKREEK